MQSLSGCTQQRQNVVKDLQPLGAGDCNSLVLQLTISCLSKLPGVMSAQCVCWRMDLGSIYSYHNSWKDFLMFRLHKVTSDFTEIFGSSSMAFRGQYFSLCKEIQLGVKG